MKKIFILLSLLTIISCDSDENPDSNPLNGRWYFTRVIYQTIEGESGSSSTNNLPDCSDSYYQINDENVRLKEYESCENYNMYNGSYNSLTNQITIENPDSILTLFSVEKQGNELKLESSYNTVVNNIPTTYKVIQFCTKKPGFYLAD